MTCGMGVKGIALAFVLQVGFLRCVSKGKEGVLKGKREVFLEWREQKNGEGDSWKQNYRKSDDFT